MCKIILQLQRQTVSEGSALSPNPSESRATKTPKVTMPIPHGFYRIIDCQSLIYVVQAVTIAPMLYTLCIHVSPIFM